MINKKILGIIFLIGSFILLLGLTSGYIISNYDYSGGIVSTTGYYSTGLDYEDCAGGSDFLIQIEPLSCEPIIVTSDLLEEEPVTVYCKIVATQINPFIDVSTISRISLTGDYSSDVRSIGYFPPESALSYWGDGSLDNLVLNKLGYVAITLRQNPNESSMPDFVTGTLTARLTYDVENSFGIGNVQYYLPVLDDNEYEAQSKKYSFWDGRGYARAMSVDEEDATIVLYTPSFQRIGSVKLNKGETSGEFYIPNLNSCLATLKVRLNRIDDPDTRVKLKINSDYIEVADKESFLEGKCQIKSIKKNGINQEVSIYCKGDEKSQTFHLRLFPRVTLEIENEIAEYQVGDYLYTDSINEKSVYLGYVGSTGDFTDKDDLFVVLVALPYSDKDKLSSSQISGIAIQMNSLFSDVETGASAVNFLGNFGKKLLGATITAGRWAVGGEEFAVLETSSSNKFKDKTVSIKGFSGAEDTALVSVEEIVYFISEEKIKDDSDTEVGLNLDYSDSGIPKISLKNSDGNLVANFYGQNCENHENCKEYALSGTGLNFNKGDYNGFFDNIVSGKIDVQNKKIILKVLSAEDTGSASAEYYTNAMGDFETLINSYSSQTTDTSSETYGERGLYEAIMLSYSLRQMKTMTELCDEFKGSYPDSQKDISVCRDEYKISNSELATYEVQINGKLKTISFEGVYEPSYEEYGAEVVVRGPNGKSNGYELKKGKKVYLYDLRDDVGGGCSGTDACETFSTKETCEAKEGCTWGEDITNEYIELISVDEDSAQIRVNALKESTMSRFFETNTKTLEIDESDNFGSSYLFTVVDTNIRKSARITIIPSFNYKQSESKFNFSIGVEKRTILLSDEMIDNRIKSLNDSIKVLNDIVNGLDTFNRALGGVCLVTGGYLTLKNLIANSDGKAIAREEVMNSEGGWTERCNIYFATGTYSSASTESYTSLEDCFYENANAIDAEVEKVQSIIEFQNSQIKSLQEAASKNGGINQEEFIKNYSDKVSVSLDKTGTTISDSSGKGDIINIEDIQELLDSPNAISAGIYDSQDLKEIQLYAELYAGATEGSDEKKSYQDNLYSALTDLAKNSKTFNAAENLKSKSGLSSSAGVMNLGSKKVTEIKITDYEIFGDSAYKGYTFASESPGINSDEYVFVIEDTSTAKDYLFVYKPNGVVSRTYQISGITLTIYGKKDENTGEIETNPFDLYFKKYDAGDYENKYLNAELIYYESGVYKKYPALVPLDTESGWYAGMKNSDSGIAVYDASGKVRIIWLCNVGKNRLEEFSFYSNSFGDDICQQYDLTHDVVTFSGLNLDKTNKLLTDAQRAVETAQDAYHSGVSTVMIGGKKYKVGKPATSSSEIQCESYMSPKDCRLLFNVCDPVVCPSSRCDFGGNYPVADVVQTGVIGSILLCAPNWKEGIYLPVCTTGIEAGLKSWVNIEESYRNCLQEYLDKGEITGVCDKIHSIYACEFFWKEAIPLAKIGILKAVSSISGDGVRGGSEYLGFSSAWQNAQDSFDYFTQYYAAESYDAFKIRSAEEAGSAVCKVSMSVVYSSGSNLLESLTTPRSPAQYTGSFEETTLTTTTNPPTSHYKVYYYIYAGEDTSATYQVYLKGSSSSYYQDSSSTYLVHSDYISSGSYATETRDFSAPSGYTQLCISVNGAVECGFGKVSTSFVENYFNDLYLKEQATTEVKTENDCTSGTASLYSLINPNLQDIVEGIIDTDLYADGITRVCATESPGKRTDASDGTNDARWRDVGYCGDTNIRCWIDTETVKDAIRTLNIEESALEDTAGIYLENLIKSGNYINDENYSKKIREIEDEGNFEKKIELINGIINKVFYSNQKSKLYLLRGQVYGVLALKNLISEREIISAEEVISEGEEIPGEENSGGLEVIDEILTLTDARERVLKTAELLKGTSAAKNSVVQDYDGAGGINCFDSVIHIYNKAGVYTSCVYSDSKGKKYTFEGKDITIYDNWEEGHYHVANNNPAKSCSLNAQLGTSLTEKQKLENIQPGDILSVVYDEDTPHNVIFIEWVDENNKGEAKIFDWGAFTGHNVFEYNTINLKDNQHSVYMFWMPKIKGQATTEEEKAEEELEEVLDFDANKLSEEQKLVLDDAKKCSDCVTGTATTGVNYCDENLCYAIGGKINKNCILEPGFTKSCIEAEGDDNANIVSGRKKILEVASSLEGTVCSENCLEGIYESNEIIISTINTCVYSSDKDECKEGCNNCVRSKEDLRKGDLITTENKKFIFVKWDDRLQRIASGWASYKNLLTKRQFDLKTDEITKIEQPFLRVNSEWKTLEGSIGYLNKLIEQGKLRNGGKYSDNKDFVDQIYYEGFLLNTYKEIIGEGWFNAQENMVYVGDLLISLKQSKDFNTEEILIKLSPEQKEVLEKAKSCEQCVSRETTSSINYCDENLCYAIGDRLNKNCILEPGFTKSCIEI